MLAEVVEQTNELNDAKYGNGGYGTDNPGSVVAYSVHGGCHYGCCAPGNIGLQKCNRCCSYAGEAVDVESEDNTRD
ncbi:hypothetical protein A2U01_0005505 [Trifolium medium]|uniref:Uncharacterized protein n=1 Tax=Trifolium medium TaxID=97028 RepID=A0A392MAY6_9FABA|nr:hypothetical protein [Trifolium medium]